VNGMDGDGVEGKKKAKENGSLSGVTLKDEN
jgi:hypothetical protein